MSRIYKIDNPEFREKMAAFDYDWTLVNPKEGNTFPKNIDDWKWLYENIPNKIKKYYNDNFMIVIFTNQSKQWKYEQILLVIEEIDIPMFVVVATDKEYYKPNPYIFDRFIKDNKINYELSFFVGDALGRKADFSNSDKLFAENIGIRSISPEEFFKEEEIINSTNILLSNEPEIIIMVGFPGSGKSTIAKQICKNENYILIEGDVYKNSNKMIKKSLEFILQNKSIIFDATNSSIKKRQEYILFAQKYNYNVKCIHVTTSLDISYKRNKNREEIKQVPKIAYHVYKKYYEEPTEKEGFILIKI